MGIFDSFRKKKKPAAVEAEVTRHCFVLCEDAEPGDLSRLDRVVSRVFGRGYSAEADEDKSIITVNHGDDTVGFLAHMAIPIPGGEAEENADGNFLWPDGKEEAARHESHVIVTSIGTDDSPIEAAMTVSRLALVALEAMGGLGVYWGNAGVCNSREVFEDFCEDMSEEHLPLAVWLRLQIFRPSEEEFGIYTLGMNQFGLMDIEVDRSSMNPQELFEFVFNIAHYLVQSGPVIADGNTVGGSEEERILVRHRKSMVDRDRRVYKIVFEN